MTWDELAAIAKELPEVEEALSYGRPALKVRGKFFAGFNTKEKAFVLRLPSVEDQDLLIEMAPAIYYVTDHYKGWPGVLARPGRLGKKEARVRLATAWRTQAPKTLLRKFDESQK
ncbi:MAG TPA: MmcQ/YjbR family DNA-binding protein [Caulobacterales bacterium]|nr:MmcQ/YjbR family DNA-binding protein [Caulobacterales bacterium]